MAVIVKGEYVITRAAPPHPGELRLGEIVNVIGRVPYWTVTPQYIKEDHYVTDRRWEGWTLAHPVSWMRKLDDDTDADDVAVVQAYMGRLRIAERSM